MEVDMVIWKNWFLLQISAVLEQCVSKNTFLIFGWFLPELRNCNHTKQLASYHKLQILFITVVIKILAILKAIVAVTFEKDTSYAIVYYYKSWQYFMF